MLNAQSITAVALDTLGANGLDTQSAPTALGNTWFTKADNISYTEGGRVSFRKGAVQGTTSASSSIGSMVEYKDATSTKLFVSYGGNIARLELTERDDAFKDIYSPADVATSDWQWSNFNNKLVGVQYNSTKPIVFDGADWEYLEDTYDITVDVTPGNFVIGRKYKITDVGNGDWSSVGVPASASVGDTFTATSDGNNLDIGSTANLGACLPEGVSNFTPTCSLGYYGRLWVGGITEEKDIIHYSALLDESTWWTVNGAANNLNDAGYIDLKTVWGKDEIVAVHAYAGKLVIFGKNNIAIYNDPQAVGSMALDEVVRGIGCVARDSIQAIGDDIFFLSDTGVRSLTRTAEFDKLPLKEISITIKDELISNVRAGGKISSVYMKDEGLYLLSFSKREEVYVFDLTYTTERDTPRVTKWNWSSSIYPEALVYSSNYGLLLGQRSGNVATYSGYWDKAYDNTTATYKGSVSTVWIDLGNGAVSSILKKLLVVISGGQGTNINIRSYKDFGMTPTVSYPFAANPNLSGLPSKWSNAITQSDYDAAATSLAVQIMNIIVDLPGDPVLNALLTEPIQVGGLWYLRGNTRNYAGASGDEGTALAVDAVSLNISDYTQGLGRYITGLDSAGDAPYDWIQEHLIDYMLADLDTYGVYLNGAPANEALYSCNTDYDYGGTGFCSNGVYADTNSSLMQHLTSSDCTTDGGIWNTTTDTAGVNDQPANCSATPSKYAPLAGFIERGIPLKGTAKYLRIEMDGLTAGYEASLQSISLLYKQGKTL